MFCDGELKKVYEDEKFVAAMHPQPAASGHLVVFPKKHYTILEMMPDYDVGEMFVLANRLSVAVFESLGVQGTNIIVQNGTSSGQVVPHVSLHIIPRNPDDGINFLWSPKQLDQEQMSAVEMKLKDASKDVGKFEKVEKVLPEKVEKKIEKAKEKKVNYLFRQIERIP